MRRWDENDDIFDMMDKIFGPPTYRRSVKREDEDITDDNYERLMDDDHIYYTFELLTLNKEDIDVRPNKDTIILSLKSKERVMKLPYPIIPEETKVTFKNGILDITTVIDKENANRVEIEE